VQELGETAVGFRGIAQGHGAISCGMIGAC
jgi:hypothetical protein